MGLSVGDFAGDLIPDVTVGISNSTCLPPQVTATIDTNLPVNVNLDWQPVYGAQGYEINAASETVRTGKTDMDISALPRGIHLLRFHHNSDTYTSRIILQ